MTKFVMLTVIDTISFGYFEKKSHYQEISSANKV